jgi:mono/diheme cytochrome c family protein
MRIVLVAALVVSSLAASAASAPPRLSRSAKQGLALAQQHCAACHGIAANQGSPNPESPPFEDVANRPGLNRVTLGQYLRDAHNYPEAMQFRLTRGQADRLSTYIVSLRRPGYKPAI